MRKKNMTVVPRSGGKKSRAALHTNTRIERAAWHMILHDLVSTSSHTAFQQHILRSRGRQMMLVEGTAPPSGGFGENVCLGSRGELAKCPSTTSSSLLYDPENGGEAA